MSVVYVCDVCGKHVKHREELRDMRFNAYEEKGGVSIGSAWHSDVCDDCRRKIEYEMDRAAIREINNIRDEHKKEEM